MTTAPLTFSGKRLELNARTGGGGVVYVELLDAQGTPLPGFSREQALPVTGNSVRLPVSWKPGSRLDSLAGRVVRLRFHLTDCQLYAFRFRD